MTKRYHFWYHIGMNLFDSVYSLATENHGIVTLTGATRLGVHRKDMSRWVKSGRLRRIGHGVYRVTQYPSSPEDQYAIAVASMGPKAYLCGESVLALLDLAPTNPRYFHIAVNGRLRRNVGDDIKLEIRSGSYIPMNHDGIPIERPIDAIRALIGKMMPERLEVAAREAYRKGLAYKESTDDLIKEIRNAG